MDCRLNPSHKLLFQTLEVSTKIELSCHEAELTLDDPETQGSPNRVHGQQLWESHS